MLAVAKYMYPCPISERGHFGSHVVIQKQGPLASTARPSSRACHLDKKKKKKGLVMPPFENFGPSCIPVHLVTVSSWARCLSFPFLSSHGVRPSAQTRLC